jgi:hypothetical protein
MTRFRRVPGPIIGAQSPLLRRRAIDADPRLRPQTPTRSALPLLRALRAWQLRDPTDDPAAR